MATQTLISRKRLHLDKSYDSTHSAFIQSSSEQWQGKSVYHVEAEDNSDGEELPDVPYVFLADMGPLGDNKKMRIYGGEMDVCKTGDGVKALRYWKSDPAEIALYERPFSKQPLLKLVGVYPVVNGFAQLNLQDVHGKAQTADRALHVFPGSMLSRLVGFSWPSFRLVE
ncbi:g5197 [Coccomyxa viridis]|uniref:G5197 protein n=1 Tax=Coccomyxa viridis TaxID=1274662 RepID=A0ABP1FV19_9CHLO